MGSVPVYPYGDTVNDVLNAARARVNDLMLTPQGFPGGSEPGEQFTEIGGGTSAVGTNPDGSLVLRTQLLFNSAYRLLQKYLGNLGYRLLIGDNLIISGLPANINPDPAAQSWLSWNGFFDGTTFHNTIQLPQDLFAPLKVRERVTGQESVFIPMRCALDGVITSSVRTILNRQWEWRGMGSGYALFLPGATGQTDLNFRYTRFLPSFPDPNYYVPNTPWYNQIIPIPGVLQALSWYVAYEVLVLRAGDAGEMAPTALINAQSEADKIFNDQARADQRTNNRRKPRGGGQSSRHGYRYGL